MPSQPPGEIVPAFNETTALPARAEIARLWDAHGMLDNIRAHSEIVCAVALLLTDWLAEGGVALRREAVIAGALLHDISKTPCLGTRRRHDREGRELLEAAGYPELGALVGAHVMLPEGQPLDETMVVNYADKRVTHEDVTDLERRFEYIAERYGQGIARVEELIAWGKKRSYEVEATIFEAIGPAHAPADIFEQWPERIDEARSGVTAPRR